MNKGDIDTALNTHSKKKLVVMGFTCIDLGPEKIQAIIIGMEKRMAHKRKMLSNSIIYTNILDSFQRRLDRHMTEKDWGHTTFIQVIVFCVIPFSLHRPFLRHSYTHCSAHTGLTLQHLGMM